MKFLYLLFTISSLLIANTVIITDVLGNNVEVPVGAERILITDGRYINAIALLDSVNPVRSIVGMMGTFEQFDPVTYSKYQERFPAIDSITRIGRTAQGTFSLETALALEAEVAILGLSGHGPDPSSEAVILALKESGVAVVYIDFRHDPMVNTTKSMLILGTILDKKEEAKEYVSFYEKQLSEIDDLLALVENKPSVFLESRVGLKEECCETMVNGMMGKFVSYVKGENIAEPIVPGVVGIVNVEYLLEAQPEIYIATAIGSSGNTDLSSKKIVTGTEATVEMGELTLINAMNRTLLSELSAVKTKNVYAIWHHFYDSPYNIVAVQTLAKWFHPELFAQVKPETTFAEIQARLPVDISGNYWVKLP